jgi:addiction module HigA family antidote
MALHNPAHPGEVLRELVLDPLGLTLTQVAENLNVSRKTLSKVINGRGAITPEMAVRLEMAFTNPSVDHWLKLQNAYDLWWARQHKKEYNVRPFDLKVAS